MKYLLIVCGAALLSACGGGGGGSGGGSSSFPGTTVTPPASTNIWQRGIYPDELSFKNKCAVPRSGRDIEGVAFPDESGSSLEEKMWLRSWSNDTYLWYSEINDQDPNNFNSPVAYFDVLKTNARTASGAAKDNFHFSQSTEEYLAFSESGTTTGYGINWAFIESAPPRDIRVSSVEANSSASMEGIGRGDRLIAVNGIDVINSGAVDNINRSIFPSDRGTENTFTFSRNDGSEIVVSLSSDNFETSFVNNPQVLDTGAGRVAYLSFEGFQRPAQDPLIDAFQDFVDNNATDLILDLRYNGGGLLAMSSQLAYMIAGPNQTNNSSFETLSFNDKYPSVNPVTGDPIAPTPFYDREIDWEQGVLTNRTLPSLSLSRVFVITTEDTCSASEALVNGLRGIDVEVIQIGTGTCGKPFGFYPTDNCGTTYFTIQFQGVNEKGFGEYSDGFKPNVSPQFDDELPGCTVDDDFTESLGSTAEGMLAAAITRLETGACPVGSSQISQSATRAAQLDASKDSSLSVFDPRYRAILLESSVYTPIKQHND